MKPSEQGEPTATAAGVPALDLGTRLRAERLRQGMSLREMARRLGVSASAMPQIEKGKAQPSVSKLFDIVNLLNTSLDGLLAGEPAARVTGQGHVPDDPPDRAAMTLNREAEGFFSFQRSGEHETLELESGVHWRRLTGGSLPGVGFLHVTYAPGGSPPGEVPSMPPAGQDFGYVLGGELVVDVGFDTYRLGADDSISFPATTPHRLRNPGSAPTPPTWVR